MSQRLHVAPSGPPEKASRDRSPPAPGRPLFRKYFFALVVAVLVPLLTNGALEAWLGYRDQRAMIDALLRARANEAAGTIQSFFDGIIGQLGWMTHLPTDLGTIEDRRFDALRLLRQVPAITELAQIDAAGREQLRVSRVAMDEIASGADRSAAPSFIEATANGSYYGPVYFRRGSEPYMTLALSGRQPGIGVTVAEVNLKFIWDVVSKIRVGTDGVAYATDARGRLVAHPDISRVLRGDELGASSIRSKVQVLTAGNSRLPVVTRDAEGRSLIVAAAPVTGVGWMVFVEQPLAEAFAPIYAALWRTFALLLAGGVLAAALAYWLAHRMTRPIQLLEDGADQIGAGNFEHRIQIATGDELGRLASRFNQMAGELAISQERSERISRLRQFLAPQVAELVERTGPDKMLESQRVDILAIFCDLRNFTAFSTRAGPDEIMGVLNMYYSALGPIIARYEATQTTFAGDGLMMILNAPLPCPDASLRAVRMSVEMQAAVQSLAADWRARGHKIGFGIGLAKGPATVGRIGHENRLDYTAIGSVVNLASRLCSSAMDGQILIDTIAAADVAALVPLRNLGNRPLKGFDEPVAVYEIDCTGLDATPPRLAVDR